MFNVTSKKVYNNSCRLEYIVNNKKYYLYYFYGNTRQNFVSDVFGNNISNTKLGMKIILDGMNYMFNNYHQNKMEI